MSRRRKRIEKILQRPTRMRFKEVEAILRDFGLQPRKSTSSHVFFSRIGVGQIPIPKRGGRWVAEVYLNQVCELLKLDELDLDALDTILGPDASGDEAEGDDDD